VNSTDSENKLFDLCEIQLRNNLRLVYRATRDGFSPKDFHSKCDAICNTLTIIRASNGNIFGGFTEKPWCSYMGWVKDPAAYIFSLVNKEGTSFKVMSTKNDKGLLFIARPVTFIGGPGLNAKNMAIYCDQMHGPVFGNYDICIKKARNSEIGTNLNGAANFGSVYEHPDYLHNTEGARSIIAGSYRFHSDEIEVYTIISDLKSTTQ
jgi:hypothetical protein